MYQMFKDHLSEFRNRRTNVPYIREVGGTPYWFVNGRNTGQPVYPSGFGQYTDYTPKEIVDSIDVIPQGSAVVGVEGENNE